MHVHCVQRRLLVPLPNGTAAVVTSILAIGTPIVTSIFAIVAPVITSIFAIVAPVLATLHPWRLGLSIWCR